MHAVFYILGKKNRVETFLKWLETRVFYYKVKNPKLTPLLKDAKGNILVEGMQPVEAGLRYGIFGTWEFIFPKESMHDVLTFLKFNQKVEGFTEHDWISNLKVELKIKTMQKVMGLDKIPEFNISKGMLCPDDLF